MPPSETTSPDDVLNALDRIPSTPFSSPALDPSSNLTGESSFRGRVSGLDLSSAKLVGVTCLQSNSENYHCLGLIGTNHNSFCLKAKNKCQVTSHGNNKFTPQANYFYVQRHNKDAAWCNFAVPMDDLHLLAKKLRFTVEDKKSLEDWKMLFSTSNLQVESDDELDRTVGMMRAPSYMWQDMKTPAKIKLQDTKKEISFRDPQAEANNALLTITQNEKEAWLSSSVSEDLVSHLERVTAAIKYLNVENLRLKRQLSECAKLSDVAADVKDLTSAISGIKTILGRNEGDFPDVWTAISEIMSSTSNENTELLDKLNESLLEVEEKIMSFGKRWEKLGTNWIPLITQHNSSIQALEARLRISSNTDTLLSTNISASRINMDEAPSVSKAEIQRYVASEFDTTKKDIEQNVEIIMERFMKSMKETADNHSDNSDDSRFSKPTPRATPYGYGTSGVNYKQYYFADEDSVKQWMKENLSTPTHGLFVDIVSFTQFFGTD